jgi:hypothetical protein
LFYLSVSSSIPRTVGLKITTSIAIETPITIKYKIEEITLKSALKHLQQLLFILIDINTEKDAKSPIASGRIPASL